MIKCTTEANGENKEHGHPWRTGKEWQVTSSIFLLCPGTLLPGSGTEGPVCIDRQGEKEVPTGRRPV